MQKATSILLTILLLITGIVSSQTYPVISTSQITPPYSVYLSDYASASSDKLIVNLYLQDQNQSGLQVKLKITITGDNGVRLETKPEFIPSPITMYSGSPEQISGFALEPYLDPVNLNITGLNVAQFMQGRKLPEGIYQFTVEAVEYRRNKVVSNPGTAVAWLILNDPPIWNLPQHNSTITATNPQNVFFSWFPMHRGSPNSAFTTEYEFSLYDMIPQNANPDEFVNIGIPIHQSTTMNNSMIYGPAEIPLELGRKYACRLRSYDTENRDLFKNNGYSTVLVFTYGQDCITPVGINHDLIDAFSANVNWTAIPGNTEFEIKYREKTDDNSSPWYTEEKYVTPGLINQLKPLHTYEYKIKAYCGTIESEYSDLYEFTTPEKQSDSIACGDSPNIPLIDGSPPLQELFFGDVINVGGFEGIITQARGSNGTFTGKCIIRLTTFNILLKSHFTDININESYQVTDGVIIADRGPVNMINLDDIIAELDSLADIVIDSIIDDPEAYLEDLEIIYDIDPIIVNDTIAEDLEEIYEDLEELAGSDDLTEEQEQAIEDLLEQIENLLNQGNQSNDHPSFVMFKAYPEQQYGFDEPDSTISLQQYYMPPNTVDDNEQLIRWKSIKANGGTDQVFAQLDSVNTNLKFYNGAGVEIPAQDSPVNTLKIINLQGGIAGTTEIITAEIEENDSTSVEAGILNLVSYDEIPKTLVIVPVNGNILPGGMSITQFADSLNKTYGQGIVHWNIDLHSGINFDYAMADSDPKFNAWPETGVQYTPDMQALITEFQSSGNFDPENYYVFLVSDPENTIQLGIMPFFQNFAFVFSDKANQPQTFAKTTGHELGHGTFGLEHPFKRHEGIDEFSTENLMTYHPTATHLRKYQWDLIHNPVCWLDGDCGAGEAAVMVTNISDMQTVSGMTGNQTICYINPTNFNLEEYYDYNGYITYLNPANLPITLPENAHVNFTAISNNPEVDNYLNGGRLRAFLLDGAEYIGRVKIINSELIFQGYKKKSVDEFYSDTRSHQLNVGYPYVTVSEHPDIGNCGQLCNDIFIVSGDNITTVPEAYNPEGSGTLALNPVLFPDVTIIPYLNVLIECEEQRGRTLADVINENGMPLIWEEEQIFSAEYDPWGNGGALYHILASNGNDYYIYYNTDEELNEHYKIWDADAEIWRDYTHPEFIGLADELRQIISINTVIIFLAEGGHDVLDVAGMVPGIGEVFDGVNAVWYFAEDDIMNASLSGAALIPIAGWGATVTKWVTKVNRIRKFGKIIKINGVLTKIPYEPNKLKELINRFTEIGITNNNVVKLKAAFKTVENLAEEMLENPQLLDAWKILDDAGESVAHLKGDVSIIKNLSADIIKKPELIQDFVQKGELVNAWDITRKAIGNITNGGYTKFAVDLSTLESVARMSQAGSVFRNAVSSNWKQVLNDIIKTNKNLKCKTCGNAGHPYRSEMDEFLGEVEHFVTHFDIINNTKGKRYYNMLKGKKLDGTDYVDLNLPIFDELHQAIKYMKDNPNLNSSVLEGFGLQISNTSKYGDIIKNSCCPKYLELKSLMQGTGLDDGLDVISGLNSNPLKYRTQFYEQFKDGYLKTINNLNEIEYIFDVRKLGANGEAFIKGQFKDLVTHKSDEIFDVMNTALKENILGVGNSNRYDLFLNKINDVNSNLYDFIKIN